MTSTPLRSRSTREERFEERRTQLAQSALATLGELGYARTSLREIAQNSDFTHGVLHYYFADKDELILHCVKLYKAACIAGFDEDLLTARSAGALAGEYSARLLTTLTQQGELHRLWYDLRTQSLFDERLRADVLDIDATMRDMVWRVLVRYAELAGGVVRVDADTAYALFDGLFEKALLHHVAGDTEVGTRLTEQVCWLMAQICPGAATSAA